MRLKKGFTLAEILIVLMVIGVIATMTIPSMMKGVAEAQLKAGYKKAYNTIVNFAAMEKISGTLPAKATDAGVKALYAGLNSSLSVKEYGFDATGSAAVSADYSRTCLNLAAAGGEGETDTLGTGTDCAQVTYEDASAGAATTGNSAWITTDDGMSYQVYKGGATANQALTKQEINAAASEADAVTASSAVIIVDVNGLGKGPNLFEKQGYEVELEEGKSLDTITGDRYKIYVGSDGATAGPKNFTVTGRMVADSK